jgi:hypothetical protein
MNIRLQPQQKTRLAEIADQRRMTKGELARQIISRYLDEHKASDDPAVNDRGGLGTEIALLFSKHGLDVVLESPFDPPTKAAGLRPADSRGRLSSHTPSRSRGKKRA